MTVVIIITYVLVK